MRTIILLMALLAIRLPAGEPGFDLLGTTPPAQAEDGVRLKELCAIAGVRANQIHGIGIVVGLPGTGDKNAATVRMLMQLLAKKQLNFTEADLNSKNVAMVAVTADLPPYAAEGTRLPVQVSCIGDASSLKGGVLLQTPLVAADERIYAVAQGAVSVGGIGDAGPGITPVGKDHKNTETVARLAEGALVEREVPISLLYGNELRLQLRQPDFGTAHRIALVLAETFGRERVRAADAAVVALSFPAGTGEDVLVAAIAKLESLRVQPETVARVVINERTGTVVVGQEVRISPVAVSHGGLSLQIFPRLRTRPDPEDPKRTVSERVWQVPGTTELALTPPPGTEPTEVAGTAALIAGTTVREIANALNALGARPRDLVAIFQALHRAGALHAELVVM